MKKNLVKLMMVFIIVGGAAFSASSQIYVKVRPSHNRVIRTERPSRTHVWIGEEWNAEGTNYKYNGSHWASPPNQGDRWRKGYWHHDRNHGHQWVSGSWKSRR